MHSQHLLDFNFTAASQRFKSLTNHRKQVRTFFTYFLLRLFSLNFCETHALNTCRCTTAQQVIIYTLNHRFSLCQCRLCCQVLAISFLEYRLVKFLELSLQLLKVLAQGLGTQKAKKCPFVWWWVQPVSNTQMSHRNHY